MSLFQNARVGTKLRIPIAGTILNQQRRSLRLEDAGKVVEDLERMFAEVETVRMVAA